MGGILKRKFLGCAPEMSVSLDSTQLYGELNCDVALMFVWCCLARDLCKIIVI
jgi:hypothetical protein